jgi:hypothetical protein
MNTWKASICMNILLQSSLSILILSSSPWNVWITPLKYICASYFVKVHRCQWFKCGALHWNAFERYVTTSTFLEPNVKQIHACILNCQAAFSFYGSTGFQNYIRWEWTLKPWSSLELSFWRINLSCRTRLNFRCSKCRTLAIVRAFL